MGDIYHLKACAERKDVLVPAQLVHIALAAYNKHAVVVNTPIKTAPFTRVFIVTHRLFANGNSHPNGKPLVGYINSNVAAFGKHLRLTNKAFSNHNGFTVIVINHRLKTFRLKTLTNSVIGLVRYDDNSHIDSLRTRFFRYLGLDYFRFREGCIFPIGKLKVRL